MRRGLARAVAGAAIAAFAAPAFCAPVAISARTLDGGAFSLAQARGDVVVVNFWATWCGPCRIELPAFEAYYQAHRSQRLTLIAISEDAGNQAKAVRAVAAGYHFPMALDRDAKYPNGLRPSQLPMTLVFDRAGTLRYDSRREKPGALDGAALARIIDPLLAETPPAS